MSRSGTPKTGCPLRVPPGLLPLPAVPVAPPSPRGRGAGSAPGCAGGCDLGRESRGTTSPSCGQGDTGTAGTAPGLQGRVRGDEVTPSGCAGVPNAEPLSPLRVSRCVLCMSQLSVQARLWRPGRGLGVIWSERWQQRAGGSPHLELGVLMEDVAAWKGVPSGFKERGRVWGAQRNSHGPTWGWGEMTAENKAARKGVMGAFRSVGRGDGGQDRLEKG